MRAAVLQHRPGLGVGQSIGPLLDLGCGTGLIGVALSDLSVHPVVGVDLSPRMLDVAAEKKIYTELHAEEAGTYLRREVRTFPLIIAADVFCYFGALEQILTEVAQQITNDGLFIFSLEELSAEGPGKPWMLGRQGRFAHSVDYVRRCVTQTGFRIRALQQESLRKEAGMAVPGLIVTLEPAP